MESGDGIIKKLFQECLMLKVCQKNRKWCMQSWVYMTVQGQKSSLDQGHQKNLGYRLVRIRGLCYHH